MKKHELKDYNRLLRAENEALREILQMAEDSLSDGCRCGEIKLLQEENTELVKDLNDLQADWAEDHSFLVEQHFKLVKDINDLRADWAADHAEYRKTLETIKEQNTRECDLNVRLQGIIKELTGKLDTADAGLRQVPMLREQVNEFVKKNENLQEDLETSRKRIAALEADKNGHRSIAKELKKEKYDMGVELEKLKKENADLRLEVFRLDPPIPAPVMEAQL